MTDEDCTFESGQVSGHSKEALKEVKGDESGNLAGNSVEEDNKVLNEVCVETSTADASIRLPSKRQRRREIRISRNQALRKERRKLEKARKKAKRAAIVEAGGVPPKRIRPNLMSTSKCVQRVAVDMSFGDMMTERNCCRTIAQLSFCYAANRRARSPMQFTVAHFFGKQRELFYSNATRSNWDVNFDERPIEAVFDKEDIVYLTSDSSNVLETLDSSKVYIIGGLIDHNSLKGLCLDIAVRKGLAHARLPIDEYVKLKSRRVLTINQVFEILLRYTESGSWRDAFFKVIPTRKLDENCIGSNEGETEGDQGNESREVEDDEDLKESDAQKESHQIAEEVAPEGPKLQEGAAEQVDSTL